MTAPTAAGAAASKQHRPAGGKLDPAAWLKSHKKQAAAGAAAVGVAAFALHQRNAASSPAAPAAPAALRTAGVVYPAKGYGNPNQSRQVRRDLDHRRPPHGPKVPPRLPKPGHKRYTIKRGDTLTAIANAVYGEAPPRAIRRLRVANPTLWSFGARSPLSYYAGDTIRVPALHPGGHKPPPHGGHKPPPHRRGHKPPRRRTRHEPPPQHGHGRFPHEPHPRREPRRRHGTATAPVSLHKPPRPPATTKRARRRRRA